MNTNNKSIHTRRFFLKTIFAGAALASGALILRQNFSNQKLISERRKILGTWITISIYHHDDKMAHFAMTEAFNEIHLIDQLMSVHKNNSQLNLLNHGAGHFSHKVDSRLIEVLETAKAYHARSHGAYDVTILPLMNLFGFYGNKPQSIPTDLQISKTLDSINMNLVDINSDENKVSLMDPSTQIDFGSIGKGYAVDQAVKILRRHGITSALVDAGGNMFAMGAPYNEEDPRMGWQIGVRDTRNESNTIQTLILRNQAVATSGIDQNHLQFGSQEIGHIFDARNGKNSHDFASCTVVANTATDADALSTTGYILGPQKSESIFSEAQFHFHV